MKNIFSLSDKVIVVTGGAGYLGSVMTRALLEFDAKVIIADIVEKIPEEIASSDEHPKNLHVLKCDLSRTESIKEMFENAERIWGRIDTLVNCAAYGGGSGGKGAATSIDQITDDIWNLGIEGTLDVTFKCTREALPYFYKNGGGNIINIASMYGMVSPDPGIYGSSGQNSPPAYGVGKAGVIQLTKYCAAHIADRNIRVNCITLGPFPNTKGNVNEEFLKRLGTKSMLGRIGKPDEMVGALVLLASDASSYMTGSNIVVDGGWTSW